MHYPDDQLGLLLHYPDDQGVDVMGSQLINSVVTVAVAIIGVAIVAVLVSKNAQTTQVISSATQGFTSALGTAISPVSGSSGLTLGNGFPGGGGLNTGMSVY